MIWKPARRIYDWAVLKAFSPHSHWWLGVIFLTELIFFLPLDGILMLFCMHNPRRRFLYALMATLSSLVIAGIGYAIGDLLWDSVGPYVVNHLISPEFFERLVYHYNAHEKLAVFVGALLPIPFKAVTLSAGFCQLSLSNFFLFVFLARGLRFCLIAELMHLWGPSLKAFIDRHFNRLVMAFGAKIALTIAFFWILGS